MGSLQVRCALACDVLRRAGELVAMVESAAPMHAICLARVGGASTSPARPAVVGVRDIASLERMLASQRAAVEDACADLAGALAVLDEGPVELLDLSLAALTSRVAKHVASMLENARDADAEIDEVLAHELELERCRWLELVPSTAAMVCDVTRARADVRLAQG